MVRSLYLQIYQSGCGLRLFKSCCIVFPEKDNKWGFEGFQDVLDLEDYSPGYQVSMSKTDEIIEKVGNQIRCSSWLIIRGIAGTVGIDKIRHKANFT